MSTLIIRNFNKIAIDTKNKLLLDKITKSLTYYEPVYLRGKDYYLAKKQGLPTVKRQRWECFVFDIKNRLVTSLGFLERIKNILNEFGEPFVYKELCTHPKPEVFIPQWHKIQKFPLRFRQREVLEILANCENGRISCPPGWGKTYVMILAAMLFPKAKIAIVTRRVEVMQQRIYPALCLNLPDVGIVGGGKRNKGHRVMCYTANSLHHADGDEDFVLFDEGHEAAADDISSKMAKFTHARMFGFSATWDKRLDNKDMRCEAMFGPIRIHIDYATAVKKSLVVPIRVLLRNVKMINDPCANIDSREVDMERYGIWANEYRNKLIVEDARRYDENTQVLITVKTLEHGLYLKKLLPEYELVYNERGQRPEDWEYFYRVGLIDEHFVPLDRTKRENLRNDYEKGILKKVIVTPVWNVGVDMRYLQVVIRADAGASPINDMQIPGRASRILVGPDGNNEKSYAIVHDYLDNFNYIFRKKAQKRIRSYREFGWELAILKDDGIYEPY